MKADVDWANIPDDSGRDAPDVHIAGILVHSRPLALMQVRRAIDLLAGAEVFRTSAEGKLVVVAEAPTSRHVLDLIDSIRAITGVVNVSLVYQHVEPASSMQQEVEG